MVISSIRRRAFCACLTAAAILCSMTGGFPATDAKAIALLGDCDGNGIVEPADVQLLAQYLSAQDTIITENADMDGNAVIDTVDLTLLKRVMLTANTDVDESMTVMVYLCGSDLETNAQQATNDMNEMLASNTSENLNLVISAGGAETWSKENAYISADHNYTIAYNANGVAVTEKPSQSMATANALATFITETAAAYPADRYALILWDHGGGPMYGLCYDELYNQMISIASLHTALDTAQIHFEWIGFDCCVMACAEIAYAVHDYADYMIASEESESGLGWSYTGFLNQLANDPMTDTSLVAKTIIDDMISANRRYRMTATLALYDLSYAETVMYALYDYIDDVYAYYKTAGITPITTARSQAQDFGEGEYDLVDITHFATLLPTEHSDALLQAVDAMTLISKTYRIENANGVAMWFFENYPQDARYLDVTLGYYDIDATYMQQLQTMATAACTASATSAAAIDVSRDDNVLIQAFRQWFAEIR